MLSFKVAALIDEDCRYKYQKLPEKMNSTERELMAQKSTDSQAKNAPKRYRCSQKEKKRNSDINHAFFLLQSRIPSLEQNTRLPRIKTLRLAISYIHYLNQYLQGQPTMDFASVVMKEIQYKNSYTTRIKETTGGPFEFQREPAYLNNSPMPQMQIYSPSAQYFWPSPPLQPSPTTSISP